MENTVPTREPASIYGICPWCGHEIKPGEPAVALWMHLERQVSPVGPIPEMDVLDSDGVIALCSGCGDALDGAELRRVIHQHYRGGSS